MMERILKIVKTIKFIFENPNCSVPFIRDNFGISHSDPPNKDEKDLYKIITLLDNQGYIKKTYFKKHMIGGARFSLALSDSGSVFLKDLGVTKSQDPEVIKAAIRLKIQGVLKGKVSKPLHVEISRELSEIIIDELFPPEMKIENK